MAGRTVSLQYFCMAGAMIACNGFLDVLLYSLTRRSIVFSEEAPGDDVGLDTFWVLGPPSGGMGTVTTIEAGGHGARHPSVKQNKGRLSRSASTENLYAANRGLDGGAFSRIKKETTVNVQTETVMSHTQSFELSNRGMERKSHDCSDKPEIWDVRAARTPRSGRSFDL